MSEIIHLNNVSKNFGKFKALNQINLTVNKGEIHGFIGPNGAGKSTTIRIILGMLKANQGEAAVFGQDAWQKAVTIHEKLAYVPGDANLWPNLTGGQTIDMLLQMHTQKINTDLRNDLIKAFELDPSKKNRSYSKGNRQKVLLVAAFAADAELLIFDEPTSGLDPLMEKKFQELVRQERDKGKTIFLSSHILSEVEELCDTISIIRKGEIIESGRLEDMRHITGNQLTVVTSQPVPNLADQAGIQDLQETNDAKGHQYTFTITNDYLAEIMTYLANYQIQKLESHTPNLEDLFLHHYEDGLGGE